jgi:hypothetical protein
MTEDRHELTPEGRTKIEAVDRYLEETIRDGRPIEALIATKRLGEITNDRTREAARAATDGSWSWTDVGDALGMTKQAAHEKLRARVHEHMEKGRTTLDRAEKKAQAKIEGRAARGRAKLDKAPSVSPELAEGRKRIDEWEQRKLDKLRRGIEKAHEELEKAERLAQEKLER